MTGKHDSRIKYLKTDDDDHHHFVNFVEQLAIRSSIVLNEANCNCHSTHAIIYLLVSNARSGILSSFSSVLNKDSFFFKCDDCLCKDAFEDMAHFKTFKDVGDFFLGRALSFHFGPFFQH